MKINLLGFVLLAFILSGCISHDETVYRDVERLPVEFENDLAARLFYETLSNSKPGEARTESTTKVAVPVLLDHKRRVTSGPNILFNQSVMLCDTNKDGLITEQEARIFAQQYEKGGK